MQNEQFEDKPRLLANSFACKAREAELSDPHVVELTEFVKNLRREKGIDNIPFFDPWDGGVNAEVLFLLEAPGPKARGSGFISRNNPDGTAKNFFELNDKVIPRKRTIIWNIVPWYIGSDKKIRAAEVGDMETSILPLKQLLLDILKQLRVIVLVGQKAQWGKIQIEKWRPDVKIFNTWHPSPQCLNIYPEKRKEISKVLREVSVYLDTSR